MKQLLFVALFGALTISVSAQDEDRKEITGSGNVITRDVAVQSFDKLDLSGVYSVILSQGNKEEVKIEADDNLQSLFEVKSDNNKLTVTMKKNSNIRKASKLKVYITFKKLKSMDFNMVGNVSAEENLSFDDIKIENGSVGNVSLKLTTQTVDIKNRSVGNITLSGKASQATIKNTGVGSIQAGSFAVEKMDIDNTGVGSAEVNAEKELKVKDSFLGKVKNKGAATARKTGTREI